MVKYLEQNTEHVKECAQKNHTCRQISANLRQQFPIVNRGFSERNIRLFCLNNFSGQHNPTVSVRYGIVLVIIWMNRLLTCSRDYKQPSSIIHVWILLQVGASSGRKMLAGFINNKGHYLSRRQVRASLQRVNQVDHDRRREDIVSHLSDKHRLFFKKVGVFYLFHKYLMRSKRVRYLVQSMICLTFYFHDSEFFPVLELPEPSTDWFILFRALSGSSC